MGNVVLALLSSRYMVYHFQKLKDDELFLQSAGADFMKTFLEKQALASKREEKEVSVG